MAGVEAERELLGRCHGGEDDDLRQIEDVRASSDGFPSYDKWKRYEPRMRRQVRRLVRNHRAKIQRVVQALREQTTLTGENADKLVMS